MNAFDNIPLVKLYMADLKQEKSQKIIYRLKNNHKQIWFFFIMGKFMCFYSIYFGNFEDLQLDNYSNNYKIM